MGIFRKKPMIIVEPGHDDVSLPQYTKLFCFLGNVFNFHYWFCPCYYNYPWGLMHPMGCKHCSFHDKKNSFNEAFDDNS